MTDSQPGGGAGWGWAPPGGNLARLAEAADHSIPWDTLLAAHNPRPKSQPGAGKNHRLTHSRLSTTAALCLSSSVCLALSVSRCLCVTLSGSFWFCLVVVVPICICLHLCCLVLLRMSLFVHVLLVMLGNDDRFGDGKVHVGL